MEDGKKMANPRALALEALERIETGKAYSHVLLNHMIANQKEMDERDVRLLTELVYGTIQYKRLLDFYLEPFIKKGFDRLDNWVKQLLRLSAYQIIFLERIPPHAAVNEAVKLAKKRGHVGIQGFVNAVLRNLLRHPLRSLDEIADPVERLSVKTSHPTWLVKRWVSQYGFRLTEQICHANNERPRFTIRINRLKTNRETLKRQLSEAGYEVKETPVSPYGLTIANPGEITKSPLYRQGLFTIQSESSMLVSPLLNPQPGMKVLDACAAPGGKTTHLAELMDNTGQIIANDVHEHKLSLIQSLAARLGITIISLHHGDALQLAEHGWGQFDRILLDAPCSGFGVVKHKPDVKWSKTLDDIHHLAELQGKLLAAASRLLKEGGEMVYSTCTIDKRENEEQIEGFLNEHPQFRVLEMKRIFPQDFHSDGFFMAKLVKTV